MQRDGTIRMMNLDHICKNVFVLETRHDANERPINYPVRTSGQDNFDDRISILCRQIRNRAQTINVFKYFNNNNVPMEDANQLHKPNILKERNLLSVDTDADDEQENAGGQEPAKVDENSEPKPEKGIKGRVSMKGKPKRVKQIQSGKESQESGDIGNKKIVKGKGKTLVNQDQSSHTTPSDIKKPTIVKGKHKTAGKHIQSGEESQESGDIENKKIVKGKAKTLVNEDQSSHTTPSNITKHTIVKGKRKAAVNEDQSSHVTPSNTTKHTIVKGKRKAAVKEHQSSHITPSNLNKETIVKGKGKTAVKEDQSTHITSSNLPKETIVKGKPKTAVKQDQCSNITPSDLKKEAIVRGKGKTGVKSGAKQSKKKTTKKVAEINENQIDIAQPGETNAANDNPINSAIETASKMNKLPQSSSHFYVGRQKDNIIEKYTRLSQIYHDDLSSGLDLSDFVQPEPAEPSKKRKYRKRKNMPKSNDNNTFSRPSLLSVRESMSDTSKAKKRRLYSQIELDSQCEPAIEK